MNIPDKVTAKDANKYVEQAIKWMKENKGRMEILFGLQHMGLTPTDAAKYYAEAMTETGYKAHDSAYALDKAIKTCDAVDVDRISNYLWLWVEGREVVSMLFNEGLDKYSGPRDKEHKDEAYDFAKKYARKELDALYSKLKSSVEKKLKEGYTNIKNTISSAK